MAFEITSDIEGLGSYFEAAPDIARTSARLAINTVAERSGMKLLRDRIRQQVAFPTGYLNENKLFVRKAYNDHLEAVITARQRPTSLARFAKGSPPVTGNRRGGVTVMVHPGSAQHMKSAFLLRLRAGTSVGDNNFNVGLAVRLKPGDRIHNKTKQNTAQLGHNLYLLYGPSVDQVFRTVADDAAPEIASMVKDEFFRQFTRLSKD